MPVMTLAYATVPPAKIYALPSVPQGTPGKTEDRTKNTDNRRKAIKRKKRLAQLPCNQISKSRTMAGMG